MAFEIIQLTYLLTYYSSRMPDRSTPAVCWRPFVKHTGCSGSGAPNLARDLASVISRPARIGGWLARPQ